MKSGPARHADAGHFRVAVAGPLFAEALRQLTLESLPCANAGTIVWQLVHDLVVQSYDTAAVTLDRRASTPVMIRRPGARVAIGPYRPRHRMRDLMHTERTAVRDAVCSLEPDLVHAHWCYEYALGALASGLPTLVTVRDWIPAVLRHMDAQYWPYWSGRALMYAATMARARHLTANSPYMAAKVRPLTRAAVEVIPNGFPDADFAPDGQKPDDTPRAFISANNGFGPGKNVASLLTAFSTLRSRHPAVELHLAGVGYEPQGECERWARSRGLAGHVSFLGRVPRADLLRSLSGYTALVHPSKEESFGMTLVEAMANRVPAVGGASAGAVPWVLDHGRAGLLVDVNDPRDIALGMEVLLVDAGLRRQLAEAGYRHALRSFSQSRVTSLYLDAYARVLDEESGAA